MVPWLNVGGSWADGDSDRTEGFSVATALVSPGSSQSLLNALSSCSDPTRFKLPEYEEEKMEISTKSFMLKGWILQNDITSGLDEHDPLAAKLQYPPYLVGESFINSLNLVVDIENREWFLPNTVQKSLHCEIWSSNASDQEEDPVKYGNRISASLSFLKMLCKTFEYDLVIEVQINRRFREKSYLRSDDNYEYKPPHSKIFILSADGKLRDAETHYEFR